MNALPVSLIVNRGSGSRRPPALIEAIVAELAADGRARLAFTQRVDDGGAEVFVAGHFHASALQLPASPHGRHALRVHAGTATSMRWRHEEGNGFNLLAFDGECLRVDGHLRGADGFQPQWRRSCVRSAHGWRVVAPERP